MTDLPPQQLSRLAPSQRIVFVHPTDKSSAALTESREPENKGSLSGAEARSFYESLLEEPSTSKVKEEVFDVEDDEHRERVDEQRPARKQRRRRQRLPELDEKDTHLFLKAVQAGDERTVENYLRRGMPVDVADEFCWTSLMIAAAAGNESMCRFLVSAGADYDFVNQKDQTVFDILGEMKKDDLAERLIEYISHNGRTSPSRIEIEDNETFCNICQKKFTGPETVHLTTTLHIYNSGKKGTTHSGFLIPESNIGYKMLKKTGWSEQGLGPEGTGQKFPVRTILKRNRTGLGMEKSKPRVTHFRPHDERAVESTRRPEPSKVSWKKCAKKQAEKEQRIARNFRSAFQYDDEVANFIHNGNGKWDCFCGRASHEDLAVDKHFHMLAAYILITSIFPVIASSNHTIFCLIHTATPSHNTRAETIFATWAQRCDDFVFFTDSPMREGIPYVHWPQLSSRDHSWEKIRRIFAILADRPKFHWYVRADDDAFVVVDNLREFLSHFNPDEKHYFGYKWNFFVRHGYADGGAYVLSRPSVEAFADIMKNPSKCPEHHRAEEDQELAKCLEKVGIYAEDTRDKFGSDRFHHFHPSEHLELYGQPFTRAFAYYPPLKGTKNFSPQMISFHHVSPFEMRLIDFFLYRLKNRRELPLPELF